MVVWNLRRDSVGWISPPPLRGRIKVGGLMAARPPHPKSPSSRIPYRLTRGCSKNAAHKIPGFPAIPRVPCLPSSPYAVPLPLPHLNPLNCSIRRRSHNASSVSVGFLRNALAVSRLMGTPHPHLPLQGGKGLQQNPSRHTSNPHFRVMSRKKDV